MIDDATVLVADNLCKHYAVSAGVFKPPVMLKALNGASFSLKKRQTLAVVGESGCGKSTLARLVTMIEEPTSGSLKINDQEIAGAEARTLRALRSRVQIVFQNPYGSLNPRQKTGLALEEPLQMNSSLTKENAKKKPVK